VRYYYDIWSKENEYGISLLDKILHKLIEAERKKNGREEKTTMIIVDSNSIQNADTAEIKGYDAGKKVRNSSSFIHAHILSHRALSWHRPPALFMLWIIPKSTIAQRYFSLV